MRRGCCIALLALALARCGENRPAESPTDHGDAPPMAASPDPTASQYDNDLSKYPTLPGIVGIYSVSPMLALCRADSAPADRLADKVAAAYGVLGRELGRVGANALVTGQISYNNDPANFKFECLFLLDRVPARTPDSAQVVMLEPGHMLVYNFYGHFAKLHTGYEKIRKYCEASQLKVAGPMREFYVTDPATEKDSGKWLTRIVVPVLVKTR